MDVDGFLVELYGRLPDLVGEAVDGLDERQLTAAPGEGANTIAYLSGLSAADLDRVIDERWDPPVTLGVRLASLVSDCLQHAGQAAYVRGLLT